MVWKHLQTTSIDSWLWLGDNAYSSGTDDEYTKKVFSSDYGYDSIFRFLPFYPIPGNHDYVSVNGLEDPSIHKGLYFDMVEVFKMPKWAAFLPTPRVYYSYDYGNTHFLAKLPYGNIYFWDLGNPYKTWLENDLKILIKI